MMITSWHPSDRTRATLTQRDDEPSMPRRWHEATGGGAFRHHFL